MDIQEKNSIIKISNLLSLLNYSDINMKSSLTKLYYKKNNLFLTQQESPKSRQHVEIKVDELNNRAIIRENISSTKKIYIKNSRANKKTSLQSIVEFNVNNGKLNKKFASISQETIEFFYKKNNHPIKQYYNLSQFLDKNNKNICYKTEVEIESYDIPENYKITDDITNIITNKKKININKMVEQISDMLNYYIYSDIAPLNTNKISLEYFDENLKIFMKLKEQQNQEININLENNNVIVSETLFNNKELEYVYDQNKDEYMHTIISFNTKDAKEYSKVKK